MKKLMIAAAVVAAMMAAPAFAQTKSVPVDTHSQTSGGPEHDMGGKTTPAQGAKQNAPADTHSQMSGGAEHQMPATPPAKK